MKESQASPFVLRLILEFPKCPFIIPWVDHRLHSHQRDQNKELGVTQLILDKTRMME